MDILISIVRYVDKSQDAYWEMKAFKKLCIITTEIGLRFGWQWVERLHDHWMGLPLGVRRLWARMPGDLRQD